MASGRSIVLSRGGALSLADVEAVALRSGARVALDAAAKAHMDALRAVVEAQLAANPDRRVYGLNTGFGSNYRDKVSAADLKQLQRNLILSHCGNVGEPAPREVARATVLLRARSLAEGQSAVRSVLVEALIDLLNKDIAPAIPRHGSVAASGDLAPLSHVAAVLIGEGRILLDAKGRAVFGAETVDTKRYNAEAAKHGLPTFSPIVLEMKEGLALNNGCQYSAAWAILAAARMRRLIETAALTAALGVQAMIGMGRPFRADLHALRPHVGSQAVARWIHDLLEGYRFRDATTDEKAAFDGQIQDPYNLRCSAQILGPCLELIERAEKTLACEANSVTDNPIDLNRDAAAYDFDNIVSGGHFHGMPVAVDAYGLLQAAGIMARLSNLRCARYVDASRNKGLGPQLRGAAPDATESGLLIAEYTTAGLCNHIWGLAMPSHLMSMSTDSGQEDHVSMAANVAMRAHEAAERLAEILAIELAFAAQALELRGADASGKYSTAVISAVREVFPRVEKDRELSWDVMALAVKVLSGEIVEALGFNFARH